MECEELEAFRVHLYWECTGSAKMITGVRSVNVCDKMVCGWSASNIANTSLLFNQLTKTKEEMGERADKFYCISSWRCSWVLYLDLNDPIARVFGATVVETRRSTGYKSNPAIRKILTLLRKFNIGKRRTKILTCRHGKLQSEDSIQTFILSCPFLWSTRFFIMALRTINEDLINSFIR